MKLVVFGATGGTGRELVRQALGQGHTVTAYVRSADRLGELEHENLKAAEGDVLDAAAVQSAIAGQEAVLCVIGAGARRTTLREDGTRNIIKAMEATDVRRLIVQSSLGVGDSRANLPFFTKHVIVSIFLRHAFADHERQEAAVRQSSLDWTIVRPPYLTDGPHTGIYRHGFPTTERGIESKIARADVADFMLRQLTDDRYLRQAVGLSY